MTAPDLTTPIARTRGGGLSPTWTSYAFLAVWGYMLYSFGTASQYLRKDLALTEAAVGLHSTALAVGVLLSGVLIDRVAHRFGLRRTLDIGIGATLLAVALIDLAPAMAVSLTGAFFLGVGGSFVGTQVNIRLGRSGSAEGRVLLARANAWAMAAATAAPVLVAEAAALAGSWRLAMVVPAIGFIVVRLIGRLEETPEGTERPAGERPIGRLPRRFWLAWLLLVISVSIEFSFVFWGSSVVGLRTGVSTDTATLLAALFVAGMLTGRLALATGAGMGRSAVRILGGLLVVGAVGACLTWVSTIEVLSGLGLYLGGLGTSGLYPIGVTVAFGAAPGAQIAAAARASSASGAAMLVGPTVLGIAASGVGVVAAWAFLPLLAATGLGVLIATRER